MSRSLTYFEHRRVCQLTDAVDRIEEKFYASGTTKEQRKALQPELDAANKALATFLNKLVA